MPSPESSGVDFERYEDELNIGSDWTARERIRFGRVLRVLNLVSGPDRPTPHEGKTWGEKEDLFRNVPEVMEQLRSSPFAELLPNTGDSVADVEIMGLDTADQPSAFIITRLNPNFITWQTHDTMPGEHGLDWSQEVSLTLVYQRKWDPTENDDAYAVNPADVLVSGQVTIGLLITGEVGKGIPVVKIFRRDAVYMEDEMRAQTTRYVMKADIRQVDKCIELLEYYLNTLDSEDESSGPGTSSGNTEGGIPL
jgi:hypothetical protein